MMIGGNLMTNTTLRLGTILLLLLGGCSLKQPTSPLEPDVTPTPDEEVTTEEIPLNESIIEQSEENNTMSDKSDSEENPDTLTQTISHPFTENGFGRQIYETKPYLPLGETILIANNGVDVGTVSLERYEVVEDELGSGRKGLVFWLTETNTSNDSLEVGLYGLNMLSSLNVFYNELELKRLSHSMPLEKIEGEDYIKNYHVQFTPSDPTLPSCVDVQTLQPGESRVCYQTYSYAGEGDYLISQAKDDHFSAYQNYLLTLK